MLDELEGKTVVDTCSTSTYVQPHQCVLHVQVHCMEQMTKAVAKGYREM